MSPREDENDPLIRKQCSVDSEGNDAGNSNDGPDRNNSLHHNRRRSICRLPVLAAITVLGLGIVLGVVYEGYWKSGSSSRSTTTTTATTTTQQRPTGPYRLLERQVGSHFWNYYDFFNGSDSLGSAGYNVYVGKDRAIQRHLVNVTTTTASSHITTTTTTSKEDDNDQHHDDEEERDEEEFVFMQSVAGKDGGFRESVRLEGKRRFDRGLFVLDVAHMPSGCGVWPAFWMTEEDHWPYHGEIDIVEGINTQSVAKTALHTSDRCSMYAHVPRWAWTGEWDTSTGLPDTYTGQPNFRNRVEADDCWVMAAHQWGNQGCVAVSQDNGTIGAPMNEGGGGVYAMEWDPVNGYIKSWVFPRGRIPDNLQSAMDTGSEDPKIPQVVPEPESWPTPYAYFAIGEGSGCSADHFQQMRLVFNLAFCGNVAGNRFFKDCPTLSERFNVRNNSVLTCNAYIASEPDALSEAYWKIRGVYVYQREYETVANRTGKNATDPYQ